MRARATRGSGNAVDAKLRSVERLCIISAVKQIMAWIHVASSCSAEEQAQALGGALRAARSLHSYLTDADARRRPC